MAKPTEKCSDPEIISVKTRKRRSGGLIHSVTCACGLVFESLASEAMARSYFKGHKIVVKESQK